MRSSIFGLVLGACVSTAALAAADVYQLPVISSMDGCKRLGGAEPAAILEYRKSPAPPPQENPVKLERRRIYSDLCTISEQPLSEIVVDAKGDVVGVGMGNSFRADGLLTFSSYWKPSR